jgi:hypothetical protein
MADIEPAQFLTRPNVGGYKRQQRHRSPIDGVLDAHRTQRFKLTAAVPGAELVERCPARHSVRA